MIEGSLLLIVTLLAMPVRLVAVKLRKKMALSLVLRERMSPKPALSNPFKLVYVTATVSVARIGAARVRRMVVPPPLSTAGPVMLRRTPLTNA